MSRLRDQYGKDFEPVMSMSANALFLQKVADEAQAKLDELKGADRIDLEANKSARAAAIDAAKEANKEWDRVAKYTTPQLKAVENTFPETIDVNLEPSDKLDIAKRIAFILAEAMHNQEGGTGERI